MPRPLDQAGLFQRRVGAVFIDRLDGLGTQLDFYVTPQLRDINTLGVQVGGNLTFHDLGHVSTNSALLLRKS